MSRALRWGLPISAVLWAAAFLAGRAFAGLDVPPSAPDMAAVAAQAAAQVEAQMPGPATSAPPATALDGTAGLDRRYARADHTHAARVQRTVLVTAVDGTATWTFARPIAVAAGKLPPVAYMVEDLGSPVVVQVTGRAMTSDGVTDTHTSVTLRAQRSRALPATLSSLLALVNFDIFGIAAAGVKVNLWAADPTQ